MAAMRPVQYCHKPSAGLEDLSVLGGYEDAGQRLGATVASMWTCALCKSSVEDDRWEACWKCSTPRDISGTELAKLKLEHDERVARWQCLRCDTPLEFVGTKRFRVGGLDGWWAQLGQLLESHEALDIFLCKQCGKVEFFAGGTHSSEAD